MRRPAPGNPVPKAPIHRILAAYGPRMLELARDRPAGAHTYHVNVAHTAQARGILGPDAFLGVEHAVLFESDPDTARAIAREHLHVYLNTKYNIAKFRRLGYSEDGIANGGSDRIVDDLVFWGDLDTIVEKLQGHLQAGADHVGVQVIERLGERSMLAAIYRTSGSSDVLEVTDVEAPDPGPGEVRVRVIVSGVNPTDWKAVRAGAGDESFSIPNQDGAGLIDAVGDGVDPSRVGQRVWILFAAWKRRWGTAAQYSVVPADHAVPLPDSASDELGASLGIPALTAWHAMTADGPIGGKTVLVAGGAGAVGHAAIELAKWAGARVVATVSSPEKARLAEAAGADAVVDYRRGDAADQIRALASDGVDRVVEVALAANLELDLAVAAPHAVISSYAAEGGDAADVPIRRLMMPNLLLRFVLIYTVSPEQLRAAIENVSAAVAARALTTLPLHRFSLDRVADAHDAVERGAIGKVLLDVG